MPVAAGLRVYDLEFLLDTPTLGNHGGIAITSFTLDADAAPREAKKLLADLDPKAIIAIEKAGRDKDGVYWTGLGNDFSDSCIKVDYLVDEARRQGIFTTGIIDIGNEIGSGNIFQAVQEIMSRGERIASVVETDSLIVASACNFGGYALAAAIAAELDDLDLAHSRTRELAIMQECVKAGAIDGATLTGGGSRVLNGVDFEDYSPMIDLMRTIVKAKDVKLKIFGLRP